MLPRPPDGPRGALWASVPAAETASGCRAPLLPEPSTEDTVLPALPRAEPVRRFPLPATAPAADAPFRRSCAPARAQNAPPARSVPAVFRIIPAFSTPHVLSAGSFALARAIYTAEKYFPLFFTKFTDLSFAFSEKYVMMKAHK